MTSAPREWHPHPLHRPGLLFTGLLHVALGLALLASAWRAEPALLSRPWLGDLAVLGLTAIAASAWLLAGPNGNTRGRVSLTLGVPASGLALHLLVWMVRRGDWLPPGYPFGGVLLGAGVLAVIAAEVRRRRVVVSLEDHKLVVFVRRYRIEHGLPLEAVREVKASRSMWGRLWGFGDFEARVRKGTMQDHLSKPLVGEEAPTDAALAHGWDEEEHFHVVAAHPYRKIRRELENRILLARMPPKEREEQALASRLAEDLEGLKA